MNEDRVNAQATCNRRSVLSSRATVADQRVVLDVDPAGCRESSHRLRHRLTRDVDEVLGATREHDSRRI